MLCDKSHKLEQAATSREWYTHHQPASCPQKLIINGLAEECKVRQMVGEGGKVGILSDQPLLAAGAPVVRDGRDGEIGGGSLLRQTETEGASEVRWDMNVDMSVIKQLLKHMETLGTRAMREDIKPIAIANHLINCG